MRTLTLPLLLLACKGDPSTVTATPPTDTIPTVATEIDDCGNGELDEGEQCDLGDANGPDGNCLADCSASDTQRVTVPESELVAPVNLDAIGVPVAGAPAGTGAWGPANTDLNGDGLPKFEIYVPLFDVGSELTPSQLAVLRGQPYQPPVDWFGEVTLADIAQISFWTNTPADESGTPFFLVLYTATDGVDDTDWYGHRLTALPQWAVNPDETADTWTEWQVTGAANGLRFADQPVIGTFGSPLLPPLADLQTSSLFDWNALDEEWPVTDIDYGAEVMRFVSIHTSSGNSTTESDGLLDLITIELTDGRRIVLDLEP